ncbi:MAG: radical SAM protein [Lachnospiraceae bacterium]|nr:radical SAM protein [Lachnospiraceae bacterium]
MNNILNDNISLQKSHTCKNQYFPVLEWVITEKCNYNCLHCIYAADYTLSAKEWTLNEAKKLLDEAQQYGIHALTITGGEPLLHKYFFEIAESICQRNMIIQELHTNGQFISQSTLNCLKETGCCPLIKISFDGIDCHDWLRNQEGAQRETLRTIQLCVENGFRVNVLTNVHRRNIKTILSTAQLLAEIGVHKMHVVRTMESSRWMKTAGSACLEAEEYYACMLEFIHQYIKSGHTMEIDIHQIISLLPKLKKYHIAYSEYQNSEYASASFNHKRILLAADGNVFSCYPVFNAKDGKYFLGNAKTEGLHVALEREKNLSYTISPDYWLFFEKRYCNRLEKLLYNWQKLN